MPFAGFDNFADSVSQIGDKDNPQAYCSAIHKKATGKFPTVSEEQMEGSKANINLSEEEFQALIADFNDPDVQSLFHYNPTMIVLGV